MARLLPKNPAGGEEGQRRGEAVSKVCGEKHIQWIGKCAWLARDFMFGQADSGRAVTFSTRAMARTSSIKTNLASKYAGIAWARKQKQRIRALLNGSPRQPTGLLEVFALRGDSVGDLNWVDVVNVPFFV